MTACTRQAPSALPELIHGEALGPPTLTQRLQGQIQTDFIAVFKTVGERFGRFVNFDFHAFDDMRLDAEGE